MPAGGVPVRASLSEPRDPTVQGIGVEGVALEKFRSALTGFDHTM